MRANANTDEPTVQTAYTGSLGDLVLVLGSAAIVVLALISAVR
jgi:hypothetical protein